MRKIVISLVFLLFAGLQVVLAQTTVTGKVTSSADGLGLPGVSVVLKGTTIGIVTDSDGDYSITVPDSRAALQFSFIGFITQEVVGNSDCCQCFTG